MADKKSKEEIIIPSTKELEAELHNEKYKSKYKKILKSTVYILLIVVAISAIVATLVFPVLKIYGTSMSPIVNNGDIVVAVKKNKFKSSDVVAFYYNNRILVKRVIATPQDWVNIDEDGKIYVNNVLLDESYTYGKTVQGDIEYPFQVPSDSYFVLSDQREIMVDSRNKEIGCIKQEDIVGKVVFKVWPVGRFGLVK